MCNNSNILSVFNVPLMCQNYCWSSITAEFGQSVPMVLTLYAKSIKRDATLKIRLESPSDSWYRNRHIFANNLVYLVYIIYCNEFEVSLQKEVQNSINYKRNSNLTFDCYFEFEISALEFRLKLQSSETLFLSLT